MRVPANSVVDALAELLAEDYLKNCRDDEQHKNPTERDVDKKAETAQSTAA